MTVASIVASFYVVKKFLKADGSSVNVSSKGPIAAGTVTTPDGKRHSTRQARSPMRFDPSREATQPQLKTGKATPSKTPKKEAAPAGDDKPKTPRGRPAKKDAAATGTPKRSPRAASKRGTPKSPR